MPAVVGLNYEHVELVDVESRKKAAYPPIISEDINPWEETKSVELYSGVPVLSFKNVTVESTNPLYKSIKTVDQELLQNKLGFETGGGKLIKEVSGQIQGGLWAIIGASGSGKTTLLNALSHRLDILSMVQTGDIRINGRPYNNDYLKSHTGYVLQEDILQPRFTVYETLYYHSALRLSSTLSFEEREKRINDVLVVLNLEHTRDVLIGDSRHKGISGGERKRVAVAIELISRPKILFLDEPTSGLDSTTSLHLIQALRKIADSGRCSVIATLHQPQEKIFELLNNLILLRNGEIVYQGQPRDAVLYFTNLGYKLGEEENPADFLVNIVSQGSFDPVTGAAVALPFSNNANGLLKDIDVTLGFDRAPLALKTPLAWHYQLAYLFRRDLLLLSRSLDIVFIGIAAEVIFGAFLGLSVWHNLGTSTVNAEPRRSGLYFAVIHQGVIASFLGNLTYPLSRALFLRERQAGTYRVSTYCISKSSVECIGQVPQILLYSIMVIYLFQLQDSPSKVLIFISFQFLINIAALSLINAISTVCVSIELTTAVTAFSFEIYRLFAGFFIPPISEVQYPRYKFFSVTNAAKYAWVGSALNEYEGLKFTGCPNPPGACVNTGEIIIQRYGYDQFSLTECAGYTILIIIIWKAVSYLGLRFIKY